MIFTKTRKLSNFLRRIKTWYCNCQFSEIVLENRICQIPCQPTKRVQCCHVIVSDGYCWGSTVCETNILVKIYMKHNLFYLLIFSCFYFSCTFNLSCSYLQIPSISSFCFGLLLFNFPVEVISRLLITSKLLFFHILYTYIFSLFVILQCLNMRTLIHNGFWFWVSKVFVVVVLLVLNTFLAPWTLLI